MTQIAFLLLRKILMVGIGLLAIAYLGVCLFLYTRQTRLIFLPSPTIETTPADFSMAYEEVWLPVPGEPEARLHGWWIPANQPRGVILYLHGNGVNVGANVGQSYLFHQMGYSVFLFDYRGYGRSVGAFPSEPQVYEDAAIAWNYLVRDRQIPPQQIALFGHSLGGAIAIHLATHQANPAAVIVQSSFTSMRDVVELVPSYRIFPIDRVLTQRFESKTKVRSLQSPVLFIHGTADSQIPAAMSQQLYQAAPDPKQLWWVDGAGHNNVGETAGAAYVTTVRPFLDAALSLATDSPSGMPQPGILMD